MTERGSAPAERQPPAPAAKQAQSLLTLAAAGVRFGSVEALRDIDVQVRRGDFIAVIGPNGAGKTTLLHALHGLVAHTGTRHVDPAAARQAMVFQRPFMLRLSVWNNLRVALWLAGVGRADWAPRAAEALERAGLAELRARPARALSIGQQQRLALARAWAVRPDLLFLDEPTASLDPSAKKDIEALLADFASAGMTLVMSTHNLGQAKRLADRVLYLDRGTIRADLPTAVFFGTRIDERSELFLKGELR